MGVLQLACGGGDETPAPRLDAGTPTGMGGSGGTTIDAAPPPGMMSGTAVLKFCNGLTRAGQNISLTLEVGRSGQASTTRLTALTGECAPVLNQPCASVPAGEQPVSLLDGTTVLAAGTFLFRGGSEVLLISTLNDLTRVPTVVGGALRPELKCSTYEPARSSGDGGVPDGARPSLDGGAAAEAPRPAQDAGPPGG